MILAVVSMAIALLLVMLLLILYKYGKFISEKLGKRIPSISGFINIMKEGLDKLYSNPSAIFLSVIISLPVWFFEISGTYLAAKAIGYPISFSLATVAGITSFLSQTIPVTPAGIGVYEGRWQGYL